MRSAKFVGFAVPPIRVDAEGEPLANARSNMSGRVDRGAPVFSVVLPHVRPIGVLPPTRESRCRAGRLSLASPNVCHGRAAQYRKPSCCTPCSSSERTPVGRRFASRLAARLLPLARDRIRILYDHFYCALLRRLTRPSMTRVDLRGGPDVAGRFLHCAGQISSNNG